MALRDQLDRLRRGRRTLTRGDRLALEESLSDAGCPACRAHEAAHRQWFFNYESETNAEPAVKKRLERSFGLCAAHTRHLLGLGSSSSWLAKSLFGTVAAAGVRALGSATSVSPEGCPACQSGTAAVRSCLGQLTAALAEGSGGELTTSYRAGDGLCLSHLRALLGRSGGVASEALQTLLEVARERLDQRASESLVTLTGKDPDLTRRTRPLQERDEILEAEAKARVRGREAYAELILQAPCCPACAAADRTAWRFLGWLPGVDAAEVAELRGEALLCPTHLGDLAGAGLDEAVCAVVDHNAAYWRGQLSPVLDAVGQGARATRATAAAVGQWFRCHVCDVRSGARARELRLLGLLGEDPAWANRVTEAHGVCLRHATGAEPVPGALRTLLRARLNVLVYELEESRRKDAWPARWEVKGAEGTVWRDAPLLLDGEVLGPRM